MSSSKMYPYCNVFYKTDDSIGWNFAIMNGDKNTVNNKCLQYNWFKFEIYDGCNDVFQIKDNLKYYESPKYVHLLSHWMYWQELDKWFIHEDEVIPYPTKKCEVTNEIDFTYLLNDPEEDLNNPDDFDKEEEIYVIAELFFKTNNQKAKTIAEITLLYDDFEKFITNLKNKKFAVLHIEEFSADKYIAWEKDNKVRFMVHDYSGISKEYVPIELDALVDKDIFYSKFEHFYANLKADSEKLKQELIETVNNK